LQIGTLRFHQSSSINFHDDNFNEPVNCTPFQEAFFLERFFWKD